MSLKLLISSTSSTSPTLPISSMKLTLFIELWTLKLFADWPTERPTNRRTLSRRELQLKNTCFSHHMFIKPCHGGCNYHDTHFARIKTMQNQFVEYICTERTPRTRHISWIKQTKPTNHFSFSNNIVDLFRTSEVSNQGKFFLQWTNYGYHLLYVVPRAGYLFWYDRPVKHKRPWQSD